MCGIIPALKMAWRVDVASQPPSRLRYALLRPHTMDEDDALCRDWESGVCPSLPVSVGCSAAAHPARAPGDHTPPPAQRTSDGMVHWVVVCPRGQWGIVLPWLSWATPAGGR